MIYKTLWANKWKIIFLVLAFSWMAVIFSFSHQKAVNSGQLSGSISYRAAQKVNSVFSLDWDEENLLHYAGMWEHPIRKAAHMCEYAILAMIFLGNFSFYKKTYPKRYVFAGISAAIYAATDEIHQLFIEGRSGQVTDVCIDSIGVFLGLFGIWMIFQIYKGIRKRVTDNG